MRGILVVLDECGAHSGLTPLYARAPKGHRAYGSAPRNRGKNTTVIAALNWSGMGESLILDGSGENPRLLHGSATLRASLVGGFASLS